MAVVLATARHGLQAALNDLGRYPVTSASTSSVTITALADATANASTARYDGAWVYVATGAAVGNQRRVQNDGFIPVSGALSLELTWVAPSANDIVEITRLFPCVEQVSEGTTYLSLLNKGLQKLWTYDEITLTITTADTYSLSTYAAWLNHPDRLDRDAAGRLKIYEPAPVSGRAPISSAWRGWEARFDGPAPYLKVNAPFSAASGSITLGVKRPAHTLISGTESSDGFVSEGHTAEVSEADLVASALEEAYLDLMNRSPGRPSPNWAEKWAAQKAHVESLYFFDRTRFARQAPPQTTEAA